MTTEAEQKDLDLLKSQIRDIEHSTFDLMREYMRMDTESLGHCGHKTVESALKSSMQSALKDIEKANKAFLKKWPD